MDVAQKAISGRGWMGWKSLGGVFSANKSLEIFLRIKYANQYQSTNLQALKLKLIRWQ